MTSSTMIFLYSGDFVLYQHNGTCDFITTTFYEAGPVSLPWGTIVPSKSTNIAAVDVSAIADNYAVLNMLVSAIRNWNISIAVSDGVYDVTDGIDGDITPEWSKDNLSNSLNSFKTVYEFHQFAVMSGFDMNMITVRFNSLGLSAMWYMMKDPEYALLLWFTDENLISIEQIVGKIGNIYTHLVKLKQVLNPPTLIDIFSRVLSLNINTMFNGYNKAVTDKLSALSKDMMCNSDNLLFNPFENADYDAYFTRCVPAIVNVDGVDKPYDLAVFPCSLPGAKVIQEGERAICSKDECVARFNEFTCGIFTAGTQFPLLLDADLLSNISIAGGSISKVITPSINIADDTFGSDIDIFIISKPKERLKYYIKLLEAFKSPRTIFAHNNSVTSVYVVGMTRPVQIISSNSVSNYDNVSRFDFSDRMWTCLIDKSLDLTFYGTASACWTQRTGISFSTNYVRFNNDRLIKSVFAGFSIMRNAVVEASINIEAAFNSAATLETVRQAMLSTYIPEETAMWRNQPSLYISRAIATINDTKKYLHVSQDYHLFEESIVVGGNFAIGYNVAESFSKFDVNKISNFKAAVGTRAVAVRRGATLYKLSLGILTLEKIEKFGRQDNITYFGDRVKVKFTVACSEELIKWTQLLESTVYNGFVRDRVITQRLIEGGKLALYITENRTNNNYNSPNDALEFSINGSEDKISLNEISTDHRITFIVQPYIFRNPNTGYGVFLSISRLVVHIPEVVYNAAAAGLNDDLSDDSSDEVADSAADAANIDYEE